MELEDPWKGLRTEVSRGDISDNAAQGGEGQPTVGGRTTSSNPTTARTVRHVVCLPPLGSVRLSASPSHSGLVERDHATVSPMTWPQAPEIVLQRASNDDAHRGAAAQAESILERLRAMGLLGPPTPDVDGVETKVP